MTTRRALDYRTFEELLNDLALLERGYERAGQWSLGVAAEHVARVAETSLDPAKGIVPAPLRPLLRWIVLRNILRKRGMPRGVPAPKSIAPNLNVTDANGLTALRTAIARMRSLNTEAVMHGVFGRMPRETYHDLQLVHAAHHFSMLVPTTVGLVPTTVG